jgi:hypothetical protein
MEWLARGTTTPSRPDLTKEQEPLHSTCRGRKITSPPSPAAILFAGWNRRAAVCLKYRCIRLAHAGPRYLSPLSSCPHGRGNTGSGFTSRSNRGAKCADERSVLRQQSCYVRYCLVGRQGKLGSTAWLRRSIHRDVLGWHGCLNALLLSFHLQTLRKLDPRLSHFHQHRFALSVAHDSRQAQALSRHRRVLFGLRHLSPAV